MKKPAVILLLALAGCTTIHGRRAVPDSKINNIDVWSATAPARPYEVLATIEREGADESATYAQEEAFIADEAKQRGANAMIIVDTEMVVSRTDANDNRTIMAPKVEAELIRYQ